MQRKAHIISAFLMWAFFFSPHALANTVYSQPNNNVSAELWTSSGHTSSTYLFTNDNGAQTAFFYLGRPFAFATSTATMKVRAIVASIDDGTNGSGGLGLFDLTTNTSVCAESSDTVSTHNQYYVHETTCNAISGTINANDEIAVLIGVVYSQTHQDAVFVQGTGGGTSWRSFTPYVEIANGDFDTAVPSATSTQGNVLSPTVQAIGVATTTAASLCTTQNASSTGILDTITNGFGTAMCYAGVILFVPSGTSVSNFYTLASTTANKFPFSYLYQIQTILQSVAASSTDNFISLSATVGTSSSSFYIVNAPLISTSSLSSIFPDNVRNGLKSVLSMVFYMSAGLYIYRKIMNVWHPHQV